MASVVDSMVNTRFSRPTQHRSFADAWVQPQPRADAGFALDVGNAGGGAAVGRVDRRATGGDESVEKRKCGRLVDVGAEVRRVENEVTDHVANATRRHFPKMWMLYVLCRRSHRT